MKTSTLRKLQREERQKLILSTLMKRSKGRHYKSKEYHGLNFTGLWNELQKGNIQMSKITFTQEIRRMEDKGLIKRNIINKREHIFEISKLSRLIEQSIDGFKEWIKTHLKLLNTELKSIKNESQLKSFLENRRRWYMELPIRHIIPLEEIPFIENSNLQQSLLLRYSQQLAEFYSELSKLIHNKIISTVGMKNVKTFLERYRKDLLKRLS